MKPESSLSQRVAKGGVWVFTLRLLEKGLGLIRLVILARLLAPHDFGLFGIALLAMSTLETFSQTGFQAALVQKKKNIANYLDTAWTVSVIRGFILFILVLLAAPYVALFFNTPKASLIIQVIGISLFLGGFTNIGILYFQKELEFNRQFIYRLSTTLFEFLVVISAALILKSVWALVFGMLAGSLTALAASYLIHPYRPRFMFDLSKTRELFGFGKWVFGSSILIFLITQGDDIFVGKMLGMVALGFYQMAYRISNMPATEITHVISQVTFPAYSKMQDNLPRLREAYLRVLQMTAFLSFPIAGLIFVLAPDFTRIFLGGQWMPMVPAMQALVLWGCIRSLGATTGPVFQGLGKPGIATKLQLIQSILLAILIYPLSKQYGILGTSLAVVFASLIANLGAFYMTIKITKSKLYNLAPSIIIPFIGVVFAILSVQVLRIYWQPTVNLVGFSACMIFSILFYLIAIFLFDRLSNYNLWDVIKGVRLGS